MAQARRVWSMMRDGVITITDEVIPDGTDIDDWQPPETAPTLNLDAAEKLIGQLTRLVAIGRETERINGIVQEDAGVSAAESASVPAAKLPVERTRPADMAPIVEGAFAEVDAAIARLVQICQESINPLGEDEYDVERERLQALIDQRRDQIRRTELLMMPRNYAGHDHRGTGSRRHTHGGPV